VGLPPNERLCVQPQHCSRARSEVLDEHISALKQRIESLSARRRFDVKRDTLLGSIRPRELAGQAVHGRIVATREIAAVRALDLDDARAPVGKVPTPKRSGDHLFEREHGDSAQRQPHGGRQICIEAGISHGFTQVIVLKWTPFKPEVS